MFFLNIFYYLYLYDCMLKNIKKLDIEIYYLIWKIDIVFMIYEDVGLGIGRGDLMNVV